MAIPDWLWPTDDSHDIEVQDVDDTLSASEIETVTNLFETLSNPIRLEILTSLYNQTEPISYTELRESTSIEDKGRFNYHLRQLNQLIRNHEGKYTLTQRGDDLLENVLTEEQIRQYK
ncbi:citrate synthase [Halopenitus sp. H-Gu1]|uniref:DUF7347 domain-containing protein n=1 Tax=Halopenitus sp. H-Gu1 TaxID=3242697 RepID=UPI00359E23EF